MLLADKNVVIYGAGGGIGSVMSLAFAREGAAVFLAGRNTARLDALAKEIRATGATAYPAQVDATNDTEVRAHLDSMRQTAGHVDVSINLVGVDHFQGRPLVELSTEEFTAPLATRVGANFVTASAAGRHMASQGSGVILMITATPARAATTNSASFGVACAAVEGLSRAFAAELGPHGVRVLCLRSAGSPDSPGVKAAFEAHARGVGVTPAEWEQTVAEPTLLRRLPMMADVAEVAVFMASDRARAMTATVANLTCGVLPD